MAERPAVSGKDLSPVNMISLLRASRARIAPPSIVRSQYRLASTDYGSKQSGHEQGINQDNPKKHLEHPGPEPPSTKSNSGSGSGSDASPKIHQPKSPKEDQSEEVRKHNEEMKNRAEKTANQIGEEDNKVDKKFWQGSS